MELERPQQAYAAAEGATDLSRALAAAPPEALTAAQEAVDLYRGLAAAGSGEITPYLAISLNTLANVLSALGREEEARAAAQEPEALRSRK